MDSSLELPIINVSSQNNYRIKIGVDLTKKEYTDNITDTFLLEKINLLLLYCFSELKYGWFQKSNHNNDYGIIIICSQYTDKIISIFELMKDPDLKVFGYNINSTVTYLTEETRLLYKYYDFNWYCSLESFIQVNPYSGKYIHDAIDKLIIKDNDSWFYGIGGEMGMYAKKMGNQYSCLTNSKPIYEDCILNNQGNCFLVDYEKIILVNYIKSENGILLINISRNGLRKYLASQIVNLDFKQILYIGCCDKAIKRDLDILIKRYHVINILKINQFPQTSHYSYVIDLRKN